MERKLSPITLLNPARLKKILSFAVKGYLAEIGWFKSLDQQKPLDEHGHPLPWVTYSFIDFIKERISTDHQVFEFGSGNSTLFYSKYAGKVVSVEHDKAWFESIKSAAPANSKMIYTELSYGGDYCNTPVLLGEKFNIIIVDGRDRVNCCKNCIAALTDDGVIVLDDSEREQYKEATAFMISNGFKHLSFSGISPGYFFRKATSVFYKPLNCLNI